MCVNWGENFASLMSFEQFYAISSQQDCTNTCRTSDCQGYKWDAQGNCYLYYLVGNNSGATVIDGRSGKIPSVDGFSASQSECITSTCNVVKTSDLYDFNKCLSVCTRDADCKGFGVDNQQYCSLIKSSGIPGSQFTGYTFIKETSNPSSAPSIAIIAGIVAGVVVFLAILIFFMCKKLRKPVSKNQNMEFDSYYDPAPFPNRQSMASLEEPMLPKSPSQRMLPGMKRPSTKSQFKIANASYNDLWTSGKSLNKDDKVLIPGIDTSMHMDYHLTKD